MKSIQSVVFFLVSIATVCSSVGRIDLSTYPLSSVLRNSNNDSYTLYWSFDDLGFIRFAVYVSTTGWVGFGVSPDGGMPRSDVIIGWVDDQGQAFLDVSHCYREQYVAVKLIHI